MASCRSGVRSTASPSLLRPSFANRWTLSVRGSECMMTRLWTTPVTHISGLDARNLVITAARSPETPQVLTLAAGVVLDARRARSSRPSSPTSKMPPRQGMPGSSRSALLTRSFTVSSFKTLMYYYCYYYLTDEDHFFFCSRSSLQWVERPKEWRYFFPPAARSRSRPRLLLPRQALSTHPPCCYAPKSPTPMWESTSGSTP